MEKNAEFIRKKEFHIVFKGYKPEEVDKFLDILSVEFDRLIKRNRELQESLDKLKFENTVEDTDIKKIIQDALISAHKVAEDIKTQAKKEADAIIDQRKNEEEKALSLLQKQKFHIEESIIILQSKYEEIKTKMKKMIEEINQYIDAMEIAPAPATEDSFELQQDDGFISETEGELPDQKTQDKADTAGAAEYKDSEMKPEEKSSGEPFSDFSSFDKYNINAEREDINAEREGSYYYERIKKQEDGEKAAEQKQQKQHGLPQEEINEAVTQEQQDNSESAENQPASDDYSFDAEAPKRERKKIDIANPDIIENFFRASDD